MPSNLLINIFSAATWGNSRSILSAGLCLLILLSGCRDESDIYQLYVSTAGDDQQSGTSSASALASVGAAVGKLEAIRAQDPTRHIEVLLAPGVYPVREVLTLPANQDAGGNISFKAMPGGEVILDGGATINGTWEKTAENSWRIPVEDEFNQLFREGKRCVRARWPNEGQFLHPKEVKVQEKWLRLEDEVKMDFTPGKQAELCATGQWHFIRQQLAGIDREQNTIHTLTEIGPECSGTKVRPFDRVFLENDPAFLDADNEWYLDKEQSILHLYSTSDPNTSTYHYPLIETFFVAAGTAEAPIRNIAWEGLTFRHTTWSFPAAERKGIQAGFWGTTIGKPVYSPPAALMLRFAENCSISNCVFANLGEGAIALETGCFENSITNNIFTDIGSNVIQVARISDYVGEGHPLHLDYKDPALAPAHQLIANNHFNQVATVDRGGVAIWIGYAHHNSVRHNLIENAPYSGISVGWRWDTIPTNAHHNEIAYNEVRQCMQYLSDGAGIYTVSNQPGTSIHNNWIHHIGGGEILALGIYNDEGSSYMSVRNNYVHDTDPYDYMAHQNLWGTNIIKDNGCTDCENGLQDRNERVKYSDFPDVQPPDPGLYGIQPAE